MNFLGLNLGKKPTLNTGLLFGPEMWTYLPLLLIPILASFLTFYAQQLQTSSMKPKQSAPAKPGAPDNGEAMQKSMKWMGPIMTLYFSFILPAGMGVYWIATYGIQIIQQLYINKMNEKKLLESKKDIIEKKGDAKKQNIIEGEAKTVKKEKKEEDQIK